MAEKNKPIIDLKEFDIDGFQTEHDTMQTSLKKLEGLHSAIQEEVTKFKADAITQADLTERLGKMNSTLTELAEKIEIGRNSHAVQENRFVYNDYRSMVEGVNWLYKDSGEDYNEVDYRAHALFQLPVDYDKLDNGQELRNLRNLHDAVYILDRVHTFRAAGGGRRHEITQMQLFKSLQKHTERFDEKVAHAMAGGATGYGAEWLPVEMSNEFNEILRITPSLMNKFETWVMGKGSSGKFPFQGGKAVAYKGSEALVENAARARQTNVATAVKTFTPALFIAALVSSEEVTEDAIISMLDFIRKELAVAINEGLESAIINGDTGTHQDTAAFYPSYTLETCFIGLRAMAFDDSATLDSETYSADTGVGALQTDALLQAQSVMGLAAANPGEMFWVTGTKGRIELMKALQKEDALGILQFIISGKLPTLYGADVHISGQYLESLESDGLYGAGVDHTSILGVHPKSFRIAQKRGITLEAAKDIMTQQIQLVATARYDFGRVSLSTERPVVNIINVQHS